MPRDTVKAPKPEWLDDKGVMALLKAEVAKADAQIAELCRSVGIPDNLRPGISLNWYRRGESGSAERRAELRKLAHARIDAAAQSAKTSERAVGGKGYGAA